MNFNTTIVLIALVLVVGAYFYFIERNVPSAVDQPQVTTSSTDGEPVFRAGEISESWVDQIEIERRGERIVLAKEGNDWWQVEPVRFPLNTWMAGREFIEAAANLRYTAKSAPSKGNFPSLSEMQLEPPAATVRLIGKDKTYTLQLGRIVGGRGYLMIADQKEHYLSTDKKPKARDLKEVYFTDKRLHELALQGKVNDWRRRTVSLPREPNASRVELQIDGEHIGFAKHDGEWAFEAPLSGRVSREAVRSFLDATGAINIESFIADKPEDLSVFGLDAPLARLSVYTPQPNASDEADDEQKDAETSGTSALKETTVAIGRPTDLSEDRFYATLIEDGNPTGVVFAIRKHDRNKLSTTVDKLRDPRIVLASSTEVRHLKLERHDGVSLVMDRGSSGWAFVEPGPDFAADHDAVAKLVSAVTQARAESFVAGAAPEGEPLATLTLSAIAKPEPEVLRIFAHSEGETTKHLVLRNNETTGHVLSVELLAPLFEPVIALRNRDVLDVTADRLASLTLTRPDGAVYRFERSATKPEEGSATDENAETENEEAKTVATKAVWKLVGYDAYEEHTFQQLLAALLPLRATRWIDSEPSQAVGYTLELTTSDNAQHRVIIDPVTRIARVDEVDQPFEISNELLQRLGEELRDRTIIRFSSDAIVTVVLARGEEKLTINREGSRYVNAAGDAVDQDAAASLFDTLAGMRAERYLPSLPDNAPRDGLRSISITTRDNTTVTLLLDAKEGRATVEGSDTWFLLDEDTIAKLVAHLPGDDVATDDDSDDAE